ncbi:MAG: organic solvent ABC transporter [Cycloclasticus sp.]|nr:MAG: organic solvent ABC transporter [Cycloclasticus sp.]
MRKIKGLLLTGLFALLSTVAFTSFAAGLSAPQQVIQDTSDLLYKIISEDKDKLSDRKYILKLVDDVIEPRVDLEKISRIVIGKYWRKAPDEQKAQFQKEFKGLLVNTYATAFTEFDEWTIHFLPMSVDAKGIRAIVKTEIIQPSRPPIAVNYRMAKNKEGVWRVYDVIIEGISLVTNYRSSFAKSIKKNGGLGNVIKALAEKNRRSETSALAQERTKTNS